MEIKYVPGQAEFRCNIRSRRRQRQASSTLKKLSKLVSDKASRRNSAKNTQNTLSAVESNNEASRGARQNNARSKKAVYDFRVRVCGQRTSNDFRFLLSAHKKDKYHRAA